MPASPADAIWLARDLAALMDEIETEGADWQSLAGLVPDDLAGWWQVTLEFLRHRHRALAGLPGRARPVQPGRPSQRADPAGGRRGCAATRRPDRSSPPARPARSRRPPSCWRSIARLPMGAVVLPGLDRALDERVLVGCWPPSAATRPCSAIRSSALPSCCAASASTRDDVDRDRRRDAGAGAARRARVGSASAGRDDRRLGGTPCRPARRPMSPKRCRGVTLVEAPRERDEAVAIALALREAVERARPARPRWSPATASSPAASPPNCCASASAPTIPAARRSPRRRRRRCCSLLRAGRLPAGRSGRRAGAC